MGVTFSTSAFEKQYLSAQDKLEKTMADELTAYINELRKELYQLLLKRTLSKSEYNKIINKIQSSIGIHTLDVQKNIKDIYIEVLNESRLGNKDYKQAILNYETAKAVNDVTRDFYSAYNDTKQAIDHVKYVMETQSERDKNAIWNNMKNLSREKQQEGIAAYRDLFQKDYEQRIMKELTENPLLNQLITQEDAKLYISLNGKKYDLESYISNRAKYYTTNVATQIERAVDKEQGWTIFRFVRIEDVKVERPHSIHDNEHNDDYFTTDENLIGEEYNGKTLLDAYKAIEDYPYGEQPPFGCRHVWVGIARGIEDKPEEAINNIDAVFEKSDNIQGAAKFAKDTLGIDYVQYDNMNIDAANMINEEIFKAQQTFKTEPVSRIIKTPADVMKEHPNRVMEYIPQLKIIRTGKIGSKKSLKELEEMAEINYSGGAWSTNKKEHPIRHEYGHHIFNELTAYETITREKINKIYLEKYKKILDNKKWNADDCSKYTKQVMDEKVSFYGLKDLDEFGAECIAEYLSGNPRSVAKEVCEILLGKR